MHKRHEKKAKCSLCNPNPNHFSSNEASVYLLSCKSFFLLLWWCRETFGDGVDIWTFDLDQLHFLSVRQGPLRNPSYKPRNVKRFPGVVIHSRSHLTSLVSYIIYCIQVRDRRLRGYIKWHYMQYGEIKMSLYKYTYNQWATSYTWHKAGSSMMQVSLIVWNWHRYNFLIQHPCSWKKTNALVPIWEPVGVLVLKWGVISYIISTVLPWENGKQWNNVI